MQGPARPLFGTDGVRGPAGESLERLGRRVGRGWATMLCERTASPTVLVARDTRSSGPTLSAAAIEGLVSGGAHAVDLGVLPTGALCLLVGRREAEGGVIVSASHNPPGFNGIKLVGPGGHKLPMDDQRRLARLVARDHADRPGSAGQATNDPGAAEEYLDMILDGCAPCDLRGLRVVADCACGAAADVAPEALARAGAEVESINDTPEGERINVECGSTRPEGLARAVAERGAELGVAFDGDADRAVFADHTGAVVDGDGTKFVLATDLQRRGLLDPPLVVGTVMNNLGLERALEERGIRLLRTPVGDRHVVEAMRESSARLGGEQSGHIVFAETLIGDGIVTALRVAEVIARTGRSLADLAAAVVTIPQLLVNVSVADREAWRASEAVAEEIERWERRLQGRGRVLIRASGTEPVVRIMVEADEEALAREACDALAGVISDAGDD